MVFSLPHWGLSGHRLVLSHSPEQTSYSVHLPSVPSTQIHVVSAAHQPLARASCGTEGFRNAKKGTGIAAQTAGIAAAAVGVCVCVCVKSLSRVQLFAAPWTAAYQAPPPMGFSRQEYWSGVPFKYLKASTI